MGLIHSINISRGGVPKLPVDTSTITSHGIEGDSQNDLKYHGGIEKAVCIYSLDLIKALNLEGHHIFTGSTGENLTIEGLDWGKLKSGVKLILGDALIQLTKEATPCKTISSSFISGDFSRISGSKYPGWSRWYASVIKEGTIRVGDEVSVF